MKKLLTHTLVLAIATAITVSTFAQSPSNATRQRRTAAEGTQQGSGTAADKSSEVKAGTDKSKSAPELTADPKTNRTAADGSQQTSDTAADKPSEVKTGTDKTKSGPEVTAETKTNPTAADGAQQASDKVTEKSSEVKTGTDKTSPPEVTADAKTNRAGQSAEEEAIVPYYNNFFATYRLGPEDVISVMVFGQERYSRQGIKIPPSGRIYLTLIPEGIFVNGKTAEQVAELVKKSYDEYIIGPQVSVSLDQAGSYRYSVVGDVAVPGIKLMSRRLSVAEAVAEAGGVLQTGNRSKIVVLRKQQDGMLKPIPVDLSAVYKGQAPDSVYLNPGDQVIVPGNKLKKLQAIMGFAQVLSFATMFRGGW
jgi:polysaccharide export outer membrane protein